MVCGQDEILIEPSITLWQSVLDKNKDKKDFTIKNTLESSVDTERRAIEKNNAKFDTELNTEKDSNSTLNTVEDYQEAIKDTLSKLPQTEKSKKQTEILNVGLPKAYQKITDIEKLKKFYNIVSK